jgi:hypothetical protein
MQAAYQWYTQQTGANWCNPTRCERNGSEIRKGVSAAALSPRQTRAARKPLRPAEERRRAPESDTPWHERRIKSPNTTNLAPAQSI